MSVVTVGFARLSRCETLATQDVYFKGDGLKMVWINAASHAAKVIDGETGRNSPLKGNIG
jgi:hypothetical protein